MSTRLWRALLWLPTVTALVHCGRTDRSGLSTHATDSNAVGTSGFTAAGAPSGMSTAGANAPATANPMPDAAANQLSMNALLVGTCNLLMLATDPEMCTGIDQLLNCSAAHCDIDTCAAMCQNEIACALASDNHCTGMTTCTRSPECVNCMTDLLVCTFVRNCGGIVTCATTSPGGACDKLEACCATQQQMPEFCLGWAQRFGMVQGEAGCEALMQNQKFLDIYANNPRCTFNW